MKKNPKISHNKMNLDAQGLDRKNEKRFRDTFCLSDVPTLPGCYIMLDAKEKPIYVGKAKQLRSRIRSYLNETDSRYSIAFLMRRVARIDFLVTESEKEALLLENSLIKQYRPRYNVRLKDDKTYVSLRIDRQEDFPRITVVRRYKRDGANYYGPYHDTGAVRKTLRQIHRLFPLRTCSDSVMKNRARPCLYYQMKQCLAPCVGAVGRDEYHLMIEQAALILQGKSAELEKQLLTDIQKHAEKLEFEQAGVLRDRLYDLRRSLERQRAVTSGAVEDRDVFGLYQEGRFTQLQILFYRGGKMIGGKDYAFQRSEMPQDELLASFLLQYYSEAPHVPKEVLVPIPLEEIEVIAEILSEQRGAKVGLICPQRGEKRALVDLANRNASSGFKEKRLREKALDDVLTEMASILHLPGIPNRIECFDISTIQGDKNVASMVVFEKGQAAKKRYRRFSIKSVEGQDDFGSMREVLMRRYSRAIEENDLPDLVLLDGGKGQLNIATAVLQDLGIEDLPHASIAKSRTQEEGAASPERFFIPGRMNPIVPPQNGPVVHLLARIRDEAHRFAIGYHRKRRSKATLRTTLTAIPGLGPARAKRLLNNFGSVVRIREASVAEIAAVPGIPQTLAEAIVKELGKDKDAKS